MEHGETNIHHQSISVLKLLILLIRQFCRELKNNLVKVPLG